MTDEQIKALAEERSYFRSFDDYEARLWDNLISYGIEMYKEGRKDAPKWVNAIKQMPPNTDDIIFCKWGDERFMSTGRILNASPRRTFQWLNEGGNI